MAATLTDIYQIQCVISRKLFLTVLLYPHVCVYIILLCRLRCCMAATLIDICQCQVWRVIISKHFFTVLLYLCVYESRLQLYGCDTDIDICQIQCVTSSKHFLIVLLEFALWCCVALNSSEFNTALDSESDECC